MAETIMDIYLLVTEMVRQIWSQLGGNGVVPETNAAITMAVIVTNISYLKRLMKVNTFDSYREETTLRTTDHGEAGLKPCVYNTHSK